MAGRIELRGRAGVVTGASSGIGRVLARRLAAEGARLALVARRRNELEALAREIAGSGGEATVLPCDVADAGQVRAAAAEAMARLGPLDLLVNNAGYGGHRPFLEWDAEDAERMFRVNTLGAIHWAQALLPGMVERGGGCVVFMASVAGKLAVPGESVYAATKFALVGLAESISCEVEPAGVHVLTVCPGTVRTPFFDAEMLARMPAAARRRMVEPEALVDAILDALARRRRELTYPRSIGFAYRVRALFPSLFRAGMLRATRDGQA